MARTYLGVDIDQDRLHIVCLEQGGDGLFVRGVANREIDGIDRAAEVVAELIQEWALAAPRVAAALPIDHIFSRIVTFPFADPRKIAAAVPLELAAQLPVDLDEYFTTSVPVGRDGDRLRSFALAVPERDIEQFLASFDRQQLPLRVLDVAPFADLHLLSHETPAAILVTIRTNGYVVARAEGCAMQSYRQSRLTALLSDQALSEMIAREVRSLSVQVPEVRLPIYLSGSGLTVARQRALIDLLPGATVPEVQFESGRLQAEYLPALALARRAALPERKAGGNLRQGRHAYSGSLAPFRRQLIAIAVLLVLSLVATAVGFWFNYSSKAGELDRIDQALQAIYKESFPRSPVPVDVPLFMASNLAGLYAESRLLGTAQISPLQALESLTEGVGVETGIEVQELNFDAEGVTLSGRTTSFDAVDQLAARLRQKPIFSQVQIGDAKMSVDGSRVDFRVDIEFGSAGGKQR